MDIYGDNVMVISPARAQTFPFTFYLFTTVARAPGVDRYKSWKQSKKVIDEPNLMGHIRRNIAVKIKASLVPAFLRIALVGDNSKKQLASPRIGGSVTIHR